MDPHALAEEGLQHLKALVAFDTTNPPGNELPAARYLERVLRAEGLDPVVIESAPNRGNVVARLKGEGTSKPLLLISHLDVVPADPTGWEVPPFGAMEKDGYLYGRGTLDMKQMTAMSLVTLIHLKRQGLRLKRDLIFAAVADEEAGGQLGAGYLVKNHPDLIQAEFALGEVGGFKFQIKKKNYFMVQVAERGCAWCKVRFRGEPGHASVPDPDSAIHQLARALARLGRKGLPRHVTDPVRLFVEIAAAQQKPLVRWVLKGLLRTFRHRLSMALMDREQARLFYAQLHNTASPTILRAGEKENVNPSLAEAVLDGRVLPGQDWESFCRELQKVLGKKAQIELLQWMEPLVYSHETLLYDVIQRVLKKREPDAQVVPYLCTAFTDAKHLHKLGIVTYGFSPMNNAPTEKIAKLIHGHNERIGIDAFRWGVEVLAEVVERFCTATSPQTLVDAFIGDILQPDATMPDPGKMGPVNPPAPNADQEPLP